MTTLHLSKATRIEGNAHIHIELEGGRVTAARFMVQEFRGFEKFLRGRQVEYAPQIVSRVCGLCSVAHQVASLKAFEAETEYSFAALSTDRYAQFRSKAGEIYTLGIVVKARVDNLDSGRDPELEGLYDKLAVKAQRVIVRASLKFMNVLSQLEALPLGAREIFTTELRSLYDANERLKDPRLKAHIDAEFEKKLHTAEAVLHTIIEKAPQLLSFGQK